MLDKKIFNNTRRAFALKSNEELRRSIFIFKIINVPLLVPVGIFFTKMSLKLRLPVEWIIKKTIFKQFCGGINLKDCLPSIKEMYAKHVFSVLDYSVEGKESEDDFDKATKTKIDIIKFASEQNEIPFAVAKPTGLGRFEIWEKVSDGKQLSESETKEWEKIKARVDSICQAAYDYKVRVMFDAEESWMQNAADDLIEAMMVKYNKEDIYIYNTIQCYRWDRFAYVKELIQKSEDNGFKLGFKIVRGAYMEKENLRASRFNYPTPICEDKEATDVNFNAVMCLCLDNLDKLSLFIGTHNEVSTYMAIQILDQMEMDYSDQKVWFGQLYGMSDHISFNLGHEKLNAVKLIPFGPVRDVVPYLFRRAQENSSVQGQSSRELSLLLEERDRRKGSFVKTVE